MKPSKLMTTVDVPNAPKECAVQSTDETNVDENDKIYNVVQLKLCNIGEERQDRGIDVNLCDDTLLNYFL